MRISSENAAPYPVAMTIDDDENVLAYVSAVVQKAGFSVKSFTSADRAIKELPIIRPSLVVTDLWMPVADGFEVLSSVVQMDSRVPVIMLTGAGDTQIAVEAMKRGAADYVCKPVEPERLQSAILAARVLREDVTVELGTGSPSGKAHPLSELHTLRRQVQSSTAETLHALIAALDARERETNRHSLRVSAYCTYLAEKMGAFGSELASIRRGALLHDIGKIGISDSILLKPGPLTAEEWKVMKSHPEMGFRIVHGLGWLKGGEQIVLHHHEHFDGRGYPAGLYGVEIPFGARLFAVIDAFDALTTDRPYRKARGYDEAIAEIQRCSGTQFDPSVVSAFVGISRETWAALAEEACEESQLAKAL